MIGAAKTGQQGEDHCGIFWKGFSIQGQGSGAAPEVPGGHQRGGAHRRQAQHAGPPNDHVPQPRTKKGEVREDIA